jgi:hypothetical protein
VIDVLANWDYSKVIDSGASHHYDSGYGIPDLRAKRASGTPFEQLSEDERYNLAFQCGCVRQNLAVYLIGTDLLYITEINRQRLANKLIPPNIWYPESAGRYVQFEEYMATKSDNPNDVRNAQLRQQTYRAPRDPVTIGRYYEYPLLLDGFNRAALLWKFGPDYETLLVPRSLE